MKRRQKMNAKRHTATVGGQVCHFDSMAEHRYAEYLERERKARRIVRWEHHPEALEVVDALSQVKLFRMEVDFRVVARTPIDPAGEVQWHEVKGMATAAWRLKRRMLEVLTAHVYVVIDAGRGVCATGEGEPALFDERPRRKRRARKSPRKSGRK